MFPSVNRAGNPIISTQREIFLNCVESVLFFTGKSSFFPHIGQWLKNMWRFSGFFPHFWGFLLYVWKIQRKWETFLLFFHIFLIICCMCGNSVYHYQELWKHVATFRLEGQDFLTTFQSGASILPPLIWICWGNDISDKSQFIEVMTPLQIPVCRNYAYETNPDLSLQLQIYHKF